VSLLFLKCLSSFPSFFLFFGAETWERVSSRAMPFLGYCHPVEIFIWSMVHLMGSMVNPMGVSGPGLIWMHYGEEALKFL
jgi:hypothetical protein